MVHASLTLYALMPNPNSFQTHPNTPCLAFASAGKRCCCLTKTPAVCTSCHSLPKFHFGFLRCLSPVFCIADIPAKQKSIEINGILLMINGGLYIYILNLDLFENIAHHYIPFGSKYLLRRYFSPQIVYPKCIQSSHLDP